jgi:hypothetical protein
MPHKETAPEVWTAGAVRDERRQTQFNSPDSAVPLIRRLLAQERTRLARRITERFDVGLSANLDRLLVAEDCIAEIEGSDADGRG